MNDEKRPEATSHLNRRDAIKRAGQVLGTSLLGFSIASALDAQTKRSENRRNPIHLNRADMETVSAISERILPATDTPGALDAGVPEFIDIIYGNYMSDKERVALTQGLRQMNSVSRKGHKAPYANLSPEIQDDILRAVAEESKGGGRAFFRMIRELTMIGYFTSELVGTEVLLFDPIPGMYEGCIPISEVDNTAWTI